MSGLSAARTLADARGYEVIVVEGRTRLGGRIWTNREAYQGAVGAEVDLGAAWIHGAVKDNPLVGLRDAQSIQTLTTNWDSAVVKDYTDAQVKAAYDKLVKLTGAQVAGRKPPDISLQDSLASFDADKVLPLPLSQHHLASSLEFDLGAPLDQVSAMSWDLDSEFGEGDPDALFPGGYDTILGKLKAGLDVRTNSTVTAVRVLAKDGPCTGRTEVVIAGSAASPLCCDRVIVTVPLGVLKAGAIEFTPALSATKTKAIKALGFGVTNKVLAVFDQVFWPDKDTFAVAGTPSDRGRLRFWINGFKASGNKAPALVGILTGESAEAVESMTVANVTDLVNQRMTEIFGAQARKVVTVSWSRWRTDPMARGSYSFSATGARGMSDFDDLESPESPQLLFAGEATTGVYRGTVHGAYLSGVNTAKRIIAGKFAPGATVSGTTPLLPPIKIIGLLTLLVIFT